MKFSELSIKQAFKDALAALGLSEMTPIQQKAIPVLLSGRDIIGKSQTGTGKTFAFAIPAAEQIDSKDKTPQLLVLLPTRELALQVKKEFDKLLAGQTDVHTVCVYGGAPMGEQIHALRHGAQIVVGTPGRVMDHIRRGTLKLDGLREVVLDEADEMLNMGFREDIEWILGHIGHRVQTALFSATMPEPIKKLASAYLSAPEMIEVSAKNLVAPGISQKYYSMADQDKYEALTRLIDVNKPRRSLIFCNTKAGVDELTQRLQEDGYLVDKIHGDMPQAARLKVLDRFKRGRLHILIATDVAARGIDVSDVDIVFNYDVPDNEEYYVHRIGRTGRAGKQGLALTLARKRDAGRLSRIRQYTKKDIEHDLIPTSEVINDIKIEHFKERFVKKSQRADKDLSRYYAIVEELKQKGYTPEQIAAVTLSRLLPLEDNGDINVTFSKRAPKKRPSKVQRKSERRKNSGRKIYQKNKARKKRKK